MALEFDLGIGVQVPPPALHFLGMGSDTVNHGHGVDSGWAII
jgi:hypothetical protein